MKSANNSPAYLFQLYTIRKLLIILIVLISFLIFGKPLLDFFLGGQKLISAFIEYDYSKVAFAIGVLNVFVLIFLIISTIISYEINGCFRNYDKFGFDIASFLFGVYYLTLRNEVFSIGELSFSFGQYSGYILGYLGFSLKYYDFFVLTIFTFSSINIFGCMSHSFLKKNNVKRDEELLWTNDNPIENNLQDKFLRRRLAKNIADQITKYGDRKYSFSIGIVGQWGSGKSTFLNQIKNALGSYPDNKNNLFINFNPWQYADETNLTKAFLIEVEMKLRSHTLLIGNINDYINQVFKNDRSFLRVFFHAFFPSRDIDKLQDSIKQSILKSKKRIIIFIDDVDRLHGNEVYEILTLIKNVGNMPNTIFILAYDKDYLIEALQDTVKNPQEYLSKFFQVEFALSKIKNEFISWELIERLKNAFPDLLPVKSPDMQNSPNADQFDNIERLIQRLLAKELLKTVRDINKLLNALVINWPTFNNEVSFSDYLSLEILRLKYGNVYSLIKYADKRFLTNSDEVYIFGLNNVNDSLPTNQSDTVSKKRSNQVLEKQFEEFVSNNNDRSLVVDILLDLFYDNEEDTRIMRGLMQKKEDLNKSVRNVGRFEQYFQNDLIGISYSELDNLRNNG